jgi:hypothetical protein
VEEHVLDLLIVLKTLGVRYTEDVAGGPGIRD